MIINLYIGVLSNKLEMKLREQISKILYKSNKENNCNFFFYFRQELSLIYFTSF